MEVFKKSLDFMCVELTIVASQQELLMGLFQEGKRLKVAVGDRHKKIAEQEQKVD